MSSRVHGVAKTSNRCPWVGRSARPQSVGRGRRKPRPTSLRSLGLRHRCCRSPGAWESDPDGHPPQAAATSNSILPPAAISHAAQEESDRNHAANLAMVILNDRFVLNQHTAPGIKLQCAARASVRTRIVPLQDPATAAPSASRGRYTAPSGMELGTGRRHWHQPDDGIDNSGRSHARLDFRT